MERPKVIYAIQHNVTKRIYIGSSINVKSRYQSHLYQLRAGKHRIEDMQSDFNEYGEDYSLFILGEYTSYRNRRVEYEWMRKYQSHIRGKGYNYKDQAVVRNDAVPLKEGMPELPVDEQPESAGGIDAD